MFFKIPKQLELQGQTVHVEFTNDLQHDKDAYGTACFRDNKICIQKATKHMPLPKDKLEHIFFHELTHWVLGVMGEEELLHNEKFVDIFGGLMYQAIKSAKGEHKY